MKRLALLLAAVALFMPACDDDDNPAGPSNLPVRFINDLRPSNEVPPITNADQGASGNVIITVDVTRDSGGTITAVNSSEFIVSMSGFPAGTVLTGAHIHQAPAGQNAGILINLNVVTGDITQPALARSQNHRNSRSALNSCRT
jgi:CHRD domain-containing protein